MPLRKARKGSSKKTRQRVASANIREMHHGATFARTARKFGKAKATDKPLRRALVRCVDAPAAARRGSLMDHPPLDTPQMEAALHAYWSAREQAWRYVLGAVDPSASHAPAHRCWRCSRACRHSWRQRWRAVSHRSRSGQQRHPSRKRLQHTKGNPMADPANIEAIQDAKAEEARRATHEWAVHQLLHVFDPRGRHARLQYRALLTRAQAALTKELEQLGEEPHA